MEKWKLQSNHKQTETVSFKHKTESDTKLCITSVYYYFFCVIFFYFLFRLWITQSGRELPEYTIAIEKKRRNLSLKFNTDFAPFHHLFSVHFIFACFSLFLFHSVPLFVHLFYFPFAHHIREISWLSFIFGLRCSICFSVRCGKNCMRTERTIHRRIGKAQTHLQHFSWGPNFPVNGTQTKFKTINLCGSKKKSFIK